MSKKIFSILIFAVLNLSIFNCSSENSDDNNIPEVLITADSFVSEWNTNNTSTGSSEANQIKLPLLSTGSYDFTVNWGDGSQGTITAYSDTDATHTYTSSGKYTLVINGTLKGFYFANAGDKLKLINIKNWGALNLGSFGSSFSGCTNLTITADDILDLSDTTNLSNTFFNCSSLTDIPSINNWDTSKVTNMGTMFCSTQFNQNIGDWDTSKVTDMSYMFYNDTEFNQDLGDWITTNVSNMSGMFYFTPFNQDISDWDTSKVTDMSSMFYHATDFNQDISGWVVDNVTDWSDIFSGCSIDTENMPLKFR